jgi:hypothetical protein
VGDGFEKAVLVAYLVCAVGAMAMFVRLMARRMVTEERASRRTLVITGVFAAGYVVTGLIRVFLL